MPMQLGSHLNISMSFFAGVRSNSRAAFALAATFLLPTIFSGHAALATETGDRQISVLYPIEVDQGLAFEPWLKMQADISFTKMVANIAPSGVARGVVIASPQRVDPDYFFHWTRDAALVMDVIVRDYAAAAGNARLKFWRMITDYVDFSRANQLSNALTGIGEPKFYVDGRPFDLDWGRPQNDGPALRALTFMRFAEILLSEGQWGYVRNKLYDGAIPANTVIKADLEYVAHHWRESNFDLWEEVRGDHFYTRLVQLAALQRGAKLARTMGDPGAAQFYDQQAGAIAATLGSFWNSGENFLRATVNRVQGGEAKSGLDVAVILGVLHANLDSGDFAILDGRVMATAERLDRSFAAIYTVNAPGRFNDAGTAIGRYAEDVYEGNKINARGNPWVLTTAALAEFYYKLAQRLSRVESFKVTSVNAAFVRKTSGANLGNLKLSPGAVIRGGSPEMAQFTRDLKRQGDLYMKRIRIHANADGSLSEQIHRDSGYMTSARDLTWSYASFVTAFWMRP